MTLVRFELSLIETSDGGTGSSSQGIAQTYSEEHLNHFAEMIVRHRLVTAVVGALGQAGLTNVQPPRLSAHGFGGGFGWSPPGSSGSAEVSGGVASPIVPSSGFYYVGEEALGDLVLGVALADATEVSRQQARALVELGLEIRDGWLSLSIPIKGGSIDFELVGRRSELGSFSLRGTAKIVARVGRDALTQVVVAMLLTSMGLSSVATVPHLNSFGTAQSDKVWLCSESYFVEQSDLGALIDDAAKALRMDRNMTDRDQRRVIEARQRCLRDAGFDPGPVDGKYGPLTQQAEAALSQRWNGVQVNWNSLIFGRFVIRKAADRIRQASQPVQGVTPGTDEWGSGGPRVN